MRIFVLILFFLTALFAKKIDAWYKVKFSIFGTVANVHASLQTDRQKYKIIIEAKTVGIAKAFSHHRIERYVSEGIVQNGLFVPKIFYRVKETSKRKDVKRYIFDYADKKIICKSEKNKYGVFHTKNEEPLPFFVKNDVLSLYFNLKKYLTPQKRRYIFYAVGGSEKDGRIDVEILEGKKQKQIKKLLKSDGLYLAVTLHQKIFASKEGRVYVVLDRDGIAKKGLLKDVILFGDIVGELVKEVRE